MSMTRSELAVGLRRIMVEGGDAKSVVRLVHRDLTIHQSLTEARLDILLLRACTAMNVSLERLRCKGIRRIHRTRWVVAWFLWESGAGKSQIARALNQDHSTTDHALNQVSAILKSSEQQWWREAVDRLHGLAGAREAA